MPTGGRGHAAGDDAGDWMRVSINDVIDAANNENAAQVRVRWPQGQDYPTSVWVDRDANMADDEIGYSIRGRDPRLTVAWALVAPPGQGVRQGASGRDVSS